MAEPTTTPLWWMYLCTTEVAALVALITAVGSTGLWFATANTTWLWCGAAGVFVQVQARLYYLGRTVDALTALTARELQARDEVPHG